MTTTPISRGYRILVLTPSAPTKKPIMLHSVPPENFDATFKFDVEQKYVRLAGMSP